MLAFYEGWSRLILLGSLGHILFRMVNVFYNFSWMWNLTVEMLMSLCIVWFEMYHIRKIWIVFAFISLCVLVLPNLKDLLLMPKLVWVLSCKLVSCFVSLAWICRSEDEKAISFCQFLFCFFVFLTYECFNGEFCASPIHRIST